MHSRFASWHHCSPAVLPVLPAVPPVLSHQHLIACWLCCLYSRISTSSHAGCAACTLASAHHRMLVVLPVLSRLYHPLTVLPSYYRGAHYTLALQAGLEIAEDDGVVAADIAAVGWIGLKSVCQAISSKSPRKASPPSRGRTPGAETTARSLSTLLTLRLALIAVVSFLDIKEMISGFTIIEMCRAHTLTHETCFAHTVSLTLFHSQHVTVSHSRCVTVSLTLCHTLSHSHQVTVAYSRCVTVSLCFTVTLTLFHSHCLSLTGSHSHCPTVSLVC